MGNKLKYGICKLFEGQSTLKEIVDILSKYGFHDFVQTGITLDSDREWDLGKSDLIFWRRNERKND